MSLLAQSSASDGGRVNITHLVSFYPEAQGQTAFPKCALAGRLEGRDFPTSWPVHKISYIFHVCTIPHRLWRWNWGRAQMTSAREAQSQNYSQQTA